MTSRPSVGPDDGLSVSASVNIRFHLAEFPDMDTLAVFTVDGDAARCRAVVSRGGNVRHDR